MCGSTAAQGAALNSQTQFASQLTQEAGQVFGESSGVFNDLVNGFSPIVQAGPSQEGFSAAEKSNLDSQAITDTGVAYKNAKAAAGDTESGLTGGNDSDVTGGVSTAIGLSTANAAASQTATELGQINEADYAQGQQNYNNAVAGLENAPNVYGQANNFGSGVTKALSGEADTANQIAQDSNSIDQAAIGAAGQVAGQAAGAAIP